MASRSRPPIPYSLSSDLHIPRVPQKSSAVTYIQCEYVFDNNTCASSMDLKYHECI